MKRLARILGVLGGVGAIAWAMRDRFVSVAISREPEVPAFRIPEPSAVSVGDTPADGSITDIPGIGPVYATRLADIGVTTLTKLSGSRPEQVAQAAQVPLSRAVGWVDQARRLTADIPSPEGG